MVDPLSRAKALFAEFSGASELRLVGGLAIRLFVGAAARQTVDVDVAVRTPAATTDLLEHLRAQGFAVARSGGWWRAMGEGREVIDIAPEPIVQPRSFDRIMLRGSLRVVSVDGVDLRVASAEDLTLLKLCAARDQDIIDLMMLAAVVPIDVDAVAAHAEADDVERLVSRGRWTASHALACGGVQDTAELLLGCHPSPEQLEAFRILLERLEGLGL